ncbi:VOC family protein [uncultured Corynebacterium sp.]|uniref:VOC family protein n=1 Tax=uncultured Corynebacterium sp. TaxID=159447 RepID=UPI0025E31E1C|nr:VOC family protein [uncultured Corynebacterium sp.]
MTEFGTPTWLDLGTTDLESAKSFYRDLFGWNFTSTGEDFGGYLMVDVGVPVGGAALNMNEKGELDPAMPAWFTTYFKVDDVEASSAAVTEHGGTVFVPAMQVGELGSMAIVAAPSGAAFGLWQAESFEGFDTSGRPGTAAWFESLTTDFDADAAFYRDVFGWDNVPEERAGARYVTNAAGDAARAGLMDGHGVLPDGVPSHWQVTFAVDDVDASVDTVKELGGAVHQPPMDSAHGRYAVVADPQGAPFGIVAT